MRMRLFMAVMIASAVLCMAGCGPVQPTPTSPPTVMPTATPTATPVPSATPTATPTPTSTPTPTITPSPGPTRPPAGPLVERISYIAVSPAFADDGTVLAIVGQNVLYRSTDRGKTWEMVASGPRRVFFSPTYAADRTLFAIEGSAVRRSTDDGRTWKTVFENEITSPNDMAFSPEFATDRTIYLPQIRSNNLGYSTNGGTSFRGQGNGLPVTIAEILTAAFSPDYAGDRTLFLGYGCTGMRFPEQELECTGIARSTDGGRHFEWVQTGEAAWIWAFAFSPAFAQDQTVLAISYEALYRSTDEGNTWSRLPFPSAYPLHGVWFAPGTAYIASDEGIYRSTDAGQSWQKVAGYRMSGGLQSSPDGRYVFAGTDRGIAYSEDYGVTWIRPYDLFAP